MQAEVPLPNHAAAVAERLEQLGENRLAGRQPGERELRVSGKSVRVGILPAPQPLLVDPCHQTAPRRSAHGRADVTLAERHPPRRQPVDVRRQDVLHTLIAHVSPTHVIGIDENDVGLRRSKLVEFFGMPCDPLEVTL